MPSTARRGGSNAVKYPLMMCLGALFMLPTTDAQAKRAPGTGTNPWATGSGKVLFDWTLKELGKADQPFCWKRSKPNGAGAVASACPPGKERGGSGSMLCYDKCKPGYHSDGAALCYADCPAGTTTTPGFCHYSFGSVGGCPGSLKGLKPACMADSYVRGGGSPASCQPGEYRDGPLGLCYPACPAGMSGKGVVCWGSCGGGQPVDCGAGCAASVAQCVEKTVDQVRAPIEFVANIVLAVVTAGSSSAATASAKTAASAAKSAGGAAAKAAARAAVRTSVKQIGKTIVQKIGNAVRERLTKKFAREVAESVVQSAAESLATASLAQDFDLAEFALDLDPTGLGAIVNAYNQPVCGEEAAPPDVAGNLTPVVTAAATWDGEPESTLEAGKCGVLATGATLNRGQSLLSCNGRYKLLVQPDDGNVCLYENTKALWCSMTNGKSTGKFIMQTDGNLCAYTSDLGFLWCTMAHGFQNGRLVVQDDGNMVVYDGNTPRWATDTVGGKVSSHFAK